jgi:hypothetical protein
MSKSIEGRLESLEAATPSRHRPPEGCTVAELCQHVAGLPPRDQALCIKSLTEVELAGAIEALCEVAGESTESQGDRNAQIE